MLFHKTSDFCSFVTASDFQSIKWVYGVRCAIHWDSDKTCKEKNWSRHSRSFFSARHNPNTKRSMIQCRLHSTMSSVRLSATNFYFYFTGYLLTFWKWYTVCKSNLFWKDIHRFDIKLPWKLILDSKSTSSFDQIILPGVDLFWFVLTYNQNSL